MRSVIAALEIMLMAMRYPLDRCNAVICSSNPHESFRCCLVRINTPCTCGGPISVGSAAASSLCGSSGWSPICCPLNILRRNFIVASPLIALVTTPLPAVINGEQVHHCTDSLYAVPPDIPTAHGPPTTHRLLPVQPIVTQWRQGQEESAMRFRLMLS